MNKQVIYVLGLAGWLWLLGGCREGTKNDDLPESAAPTVQDDQTTDSTSNARPDSVNQENQALPRKN
ncbi:hypothetical protein [Sphingobacterium suaedae]|uniref:Uncharacterized protein n=1 Tax=Sphingobacterium suaedae TaxID=1686402 RepID=A0ABW5KKF9_9SPHI